MQSYEKDSLRSHAGLDRRPRRREEAGHHPEHARAGAHAGHRLGAGRQALRLDRREGHLAVRCRFEEEEATAGARPAVGKGGEASEAGERRLAEPAGFRAELPMVLRRGGDADQPRWRPVSAAYRHAQMGAAHRHAGSGARSQALARRALRFFPPRTRSVQPGGGVQESHAAHHGWLRHAMERRIGLGVSGRAEPGDGALVVSR
jgi:hypothetical protein